MLHYRNKSVFGLDETSNIENNKISSIISIKITNFLINFKKEHELNCLKDITIRNDSSQILIKLDTFVNENIILDEKILDEKIKIKLVDQVQQVCLQNDYTLKSVNLQINKNSINKSNYMVNIYGDSHIIFKLNIKNSNYSFYIDSHNYFQINNYEIPNLYEYIYDICSSINLDQIVCIGDDSGNISLILSDLYNNLDVYVPCQKSYMASLNNLKLNNICNINLINKGKKYSDIKKYSSEFILLINPGRKGISNENINFINNNQFIKFIIYMSCKPQTLKNNLKCLDFKVSSIKSFNMFPEVENYCENVVLFSKN